MNASKLRQTAKPEPNSLDMQLMISVFSLVYSAYMKCAENEKYVGIAPFFPYVHISPIYFKKCFEKCV